MEKFDPSFYSSEDYELIARTDFEIYDKDKSGFIELSEIKEILTEQSKRIEEMGFYIPKGTCNNKGFKVDDELVKKTLKEFNKDKDDKLSYEEFKAFSKAIFIEFMKECDKVPVDYGDQMFGMNEKGEPEEYNENDDVQPEDYGQDDYAQNEDGQNDDYGANDEGQNEDYEQPEGYDQNEDYGQNDDIQPEEYDQNNDYEDNQNYDQEEEDVKPKKVVKPKNPTIPSSSSKPKAKGKH